jgi:hypothetical protein
VDDTKGETSRERCSTELGKESKNIQHVDETTNNKYRQTEKSTRKVAPRSCKNGSNEYHSVRQSKIKTSVVGEQHNKEELHVLYTNADGIANKLDDLHIAILEHKPEIIAISETKLNEDIGLEGLPANYDILREDRGIGRGAVFA